MEKYRVEVIYDAYASYDIETDSPEKAIEIAFEKDRNCEKTVEIDFESCPRPVVYNKNGIINSVTPTNELLSDTLSKVVAFARAKFKNDPKQVYMYLLGIGFSEDILKYCHITITNHHG